MPRKRMEHVVVLLPGITGSVLRRHGKDVWAPSGGAVLSALWSLGGSVKDLELKEDPVDKPLLDDGVTAPRIMPDIHLIPELWKIDGYSKIATWLQQNFDVKRGENFFEFAYDWRRDNRVSARKLANESEQWLAAWRAGSGADDAKLILIGHSMGGLVARYYLECLDGWSNTHMLITLGTPFRGSLNALGFIANGFQKKLGPFSVDLSKLLRSFTSVYQLLPIYPCYDDGSRPKKLKRAYEATIPNLDPARAKAARAFHDEIADAVERHRQDDEYVRNGYEIRTVIGTFQPTRQSAKKRASGVELLYEGGDEDGDGTVPRVSASPLEFKREKNAMHAAEQHASLQNDEAVLFQIAGVVTETDLSGFRALPTTPLALDVEDLFAVDEPIAVRARPQTKIRDQLLAIVYDAGSGQEAARAPLRPSTGGWHELELPPLSEGAYRITVIGSGLVDPVTDVFMVAGPPP